MGMIPENMKHMICPALLVIPDYSILSIAWASLGDIAVLNLDINTGSWKISTACLSAFPAISVLSLKRA